MVTQWIKQLLLAADLQVLNVSILKQMVLTTVWVFALKIGCVKQLHEQPF
jgi:hypothetical protein